MNYLTEPQQKQFQEDYPAARSFLIRCHVQNELAYLKRSGATRGLNAWERKRLAELERMVQDDR